MVKLGGGSVRGVEGRDTLSSKHLERASSNWGVIRAPSSKNSKQWHLKVVEANKMILE